MQKSNGDNTDDGLDEIVVIGKSHVSAEPRLVIDFGGGGSNVPPTDFNDRFPEWLRSMIVEKTDFDAAGAFSPQHRAIIRAILKGLSEHPKYSAKFDILLNKAADVDIRYGTTADYQNPDIGDVDGVVQRQYDGPIRQGEKITIILRETKGGQPVSNKAFASAFMEELMHLFADDDLDAHLDSSNFEDHVLEEIFGKGYNFDLPFPPPSDFLEASIPGSAVTAGSTPAILSGSNASDILYASKEGGGVFPGTGDDVVHVRVGAKPVVVADNGGTDTLVIEGDATIADVKIIRASDRDDAVVEVHGTPLVYLKNISADGAFEFLNVGGSRISMASLGMIQNTPPTLPDVHQDIFGSFFGGFVTSVAAYDANADSLTYAIKAIEGDFSHADWKIDKNSGDISCFMTKPDEPGSKFTKLIIRISDDVSVTDLPVTIRWAAANEPTPEL